MIPNLQKVVEQTKKDYPRAWSHCHISGDPEGWDFIILTGRRCTQQNPLFGLNGKRGNKEDLSWDALNWRGDADDPPDVIDCVAGAGGSNPQPAWMETNTTGAWIDPFSKSTHYNYEEGTGGGDGDGEGGDGDEGGSSQKPSYPGDQVFTQMSLVLEADYREAGRPGLDGHCGVWFGRVCFDYYITGMTMDDSIATHRVEWRQALGLPPT